MEQFFQSEKDGDDDVVTHIVKLHKNFSGLNDELKRVAKTTLPDLLLMSRIMSTMPSEFFKFKSVWESIPIEERSVNKLTERLRLIEMCLPSKSDITSLVAIKKASKKWRENTMRARPHCKRLLEEGQETEDFWRCFRLHCVRRHRKRTMESKQWGICPYDKPLEAFPGLQRISLTETSVCGEQQCNYGVWSRDRKR
ncbi:hypothetical protein AVEN_54658-1 [Araneus ventricosus]|uniref:Uncharacterized protein n=1 Tax=Araneus ventricosus TaxID=182803 RepID=A0A4Y2BMU0_ARAVE|nr:hypothetical protein AVEN_54658-1 [Araneus ventricosus]